MANNPNPNPNFPHFNDREAHEHYAPAMVGMFNAKHRAIMLVLCSTTSPLSLAAIALRCGMQTEEAKEPLCELVDGGYVDVTNHAGTRFNVVSTRFLQQSIEEAAQREGDEFRLTTKTSGGPKREKGLTKPPQF